MKARCDLTTLSLILLKLFFTIGLVVGHAQTPLFTDVPVSDAGLTNNIGKANTSRNVAVDGNGNIYVVFSGSAGLRIAKSTNRGESFLPSVFVASTVGLIEPEIAINNQSIIFVSWVQGQNIFLSRSTNLGNSFESPLLVGTIDLSEVTVEDVESVHMATYGNNVYIVDRSGENVYVNTSNGQGFFSNVNLPNFAYSDILTDLNGNVYAPRDNPRIELYESRDQGNSFEPIILSDGFTEVFFSSYTLSDGPCGTFIFVAGSGTVGYKIDVTNGDTQEIDFGNNSSFNGRTLYADNKGTIIDGYRDGLNNLVMSVSLDQGDTFDPPIIISDGDSHNIERNNFYNDIVVAYSKDDQVFLSVYTDLLKDIEITSPTDTTQLCYGDELEISFVLNGDFDDDTTISAVLSDASGNFENSIELGEINTNTNGTITVTIPIDLPLSDQYRLLLLSETDCIQSLPINLIIDGVILGFVPELQACEDNNGIANFDLTQYETPIANGQSGLGFSYHLNLDDAVANVNPINDPTNFSTDATTIFVRAFNSSDPDGCFGIRSFDVSVIDFDQITANPVNLEQCDPNGNGITIFDLTVANDLIVDNPIFSYSYYTSFTSAETQASSGLITNPEAYQNTNPFNDIIYVRLDTPEGCFGVAVVNLTATPAQFEAYNTNPEAIETCETDSNGIENFDLTEIEADILNLLDSDTTNDLNIDDYTFTYYEDEANAVLEIEDVNLAIQDPLFYQNTEAFNQTIYIRVTPVAPENRQCYIVIPFSIIVNSIGQIPVAPQYVICLTNTDELIQSVLGTTLPYPPIDTQLDATQYTFQWYRGTEEQVINMPASVILPGETGSSYLPLEGGTYTVEIEDVINGCSIYVSTEVIVSYPPESITVERTNALFSDNNTLEISVAGNGSYEFRLDNGAWQSSPVFGDVYLGEHTFYVRDIFNCGTIFQIKVVIDYPPFFTPNNDGQNDFWTIKNLDQNGAIISIFDRYGKLLKQINPSGTGWDGTYNGKLMPTDDYWFTIEYIEPLDNTRRIFKSHFTLKR